MTDSGGSDFLTLMGYSPVEINYMLDVAQEFKWKRMMKEVHNYLKGRTVAMSPFDFMLLTSP
jgi:ornithine carbamoyltransferase